MIHIFLEPEAQDRGMTFKVFNLRSKEPHLYSVYVVSVAFLLHATVKVSHAYIASVGLVCYMYLYSVFKWILRCRRVEKRNSMLLILLFQLL